MRATFCPVSGFLGAGKTTTLLALATELRARGHRPAIVTNDQGRDLVDTQLARTVTDDVGEVVDGCFCCRFEDLARVVTELVGRGVDVVLAEAVGSCTDLRATVVRPLREHHGDSLRVAPLTTVVDPVRYRNFARAWASGQDTDTGYLYAHQLAEADIVAVNKVDLVGRGVAPLLADLGRRNRSANLVAYSARSGDVTELADLLMVDAEPADRPGEELDYDRYAAAEAELGWLNHGVTVLGRFAPAYWARIALTTLSARCADAGVLVGHAKVSLAAGTALTKASLTAAGEPPTVDLAGPEEVTEARAVLNLRVALPPAELNKAASAAVAAADSACGTTSTATTQPAAFQPSYPRPTHRIAVSG